MADSLLILGGKGFVGSALVRAARARGLNITAVDRDDYPSAVGRAWDVIINANGNSKKFLANQDPAGEFDQSVGSVVRSLHDMTCGRYVFLSTVDVYPDTRDPRHNREDTPIDPARLSRYGFHKWQAEQQVRFNAPAWLILRMAGFVGPGLRKNPIYDLLTGAPLRVHPDSAYQYQHADTLAATALDLVAEGRTGEMLNVAGDGLITPREVAAMIPGAALADPPPGLTPEHYEINIDRLKTMRPVPSTRDTVAQFVRNVLSGGETLA